ncbi:MAG: hypothetical protein HYS15_03295 [Candidatus Spechtbacteria bacterium]|nr:hypothetical protein [Candidatus Spechtbacteria bacterium]
MAQVLCIDSSGARETRTACTEATLEYTGAAISGDLASFPSNAGWGDPAQSFIVGPQNISVREVQLYVRKLTNSPSNIFLEIRSGSTIGTVVGRSWMIESFSLATTSSWTSFVFPSPVLLVSSTQYFLRLRSLPDSTVAFSNATGTIYLAYEHSASSPPAYAGGDAWRYVGQSNNPTFAGERLGPADQYDFGFRIFYGINPPVNRDSRHLDFDLVGLDGRGWSIETTSILRLVFHNPGNPDTVQDIAMANYFKNGNTEFDWEGSINVNGDIEKLRVHTLYRDAYDTTLSIHRDRKDNQKAADISIDGKAIVSYAADGTATVGAYGGVMSYR